MLLLQERDPVFYELCRRSDTAQHSERRTVF